MTYAEKKNITNIYIEYINRVKVESCQEHTNIITLHVRNLKVK